MSKLNDLTGKRYGKLVVTGRTSSKNGKTYWMCCCDCGNVKAIYAQDLIKGKTKSCGCLRKENAKKQGEKNAKHGMTHSRLWNIWCAMRQRCNYEKSPAYPNYGGRGISVCEQWNDFSSFQIWANETGYNDNLTIDRIDVNGDYSPENCRWTTYKEQENNRRNNRYVTICGCKKTLTQWANFAWLA